MTREEALNEIKSWDFLEGKEIEAIHTLIPELKESEDERVRKAIIHYLDYTAGGLSTEEQHKWIAYLEKQEIFSKNGAGCYYYDADGTYTFIGLPGFVPIEDIKLNGERPKTENKSVGLPGAGLCVEKQKEQKPILEVFGFKVGDAVRLKDGDGRKHIIKSFEEVEGLHGPNFYHVEFEDNLARDGIYPGEEYPNGYYTQMEKIEEEQKPADLSEMMVHKEPYIAPVPTPMVADEQKPVQDREEKEYVRTLKSLIADFLYGKDEIDRGYYQKIYDWLDGKHIKQEPEWSEEDSKRYISIGATLATSRVLSREDYDADMLWLRDLVNIVKYSRLSWKPSEEQMKALRECGECKRCIKKLYEDLQKRYGTC